MRRLVLMALAVWLAASCASNEPPTFRFDEGTARDKVEAFESGYPKWNDDAPTLPQYTLSSAPEGTWLVTFTEDIIDRGHTVNGRTCRRVTTDCPIAHQIRIRASLDHEATAILSAHEIGHALGFEHVDDPNALMFGGDITARALNETDRSQCRRKGVCPMVVVTDSQHPKVN
jgi:hypothetical protein